MSIGWKGLMVRMQGQWFSLWWSHIYVTVTRRALRKGQGRRWCRSDLLSKKWSWVNFCSSKQDKGLFEGSARKIWPVSPCPNAVNSGQRYAVFADARFMWLVDQLLVLKRWGCAEFFVAIGSRLTAKVVPHFGNKM